MNYSDYSKTSSYKINSTHHSNNSTPTKLLSQCQIDAYNLANKQNALYDEKTNQILYGRSNLLKASGVSDGTCNQISPMMQRLNAKCGVGTGGGNPCYPNTIEDLPMYPVDSNLVLKKNSQNQLTIPKYQGIFENFDGSLTNAHWEINNFVGLIFFILIILLFVNITYYEE